MSPYVNISSWKVHEVFNKRHDNVLRDIENLIEKVERSEERSGGISRSKFGIVKFY